MRFIIVLILIIIVAVALFYYFQNNTDDPMVSCDVKYIQRIEVSSNSIFVRALRGKNIYSFKKDTGQWEVKPNINEPSQQIKTPMICAGEEACEYLSLKSWEDNIAIFNLEHKEYDMETEQSNNWSCDLKIDSFRTWTK